jgi:very-short-patch-repair endonuclease
MLDFYCAKARLAIEIDGLSHDVGGRPHRDAKRDAWLEAQGAAVTRVPATDVLRSADAVADGLFRLATAMAEERAPPPPR